MAGSEIPSDLKSHPLGLRFFNRTIEKEFNLFYDAENLLFVRVGTILSMFAWASSMVLVYFVYKPLFLYWVAVVSASIMPILVAVLVATFQSRFLGRFQTMAAVSNAAAGLLMIYPGFLAKNFMLPAMGIVIIIFYASFILRLKFVPCFLATLVYVATFVVFAFTSTIPAPGEPILSFFFLLNAVIASVFAAYVNEKHTRTRFVQWKIIEAHHRERLSHAERLAAIGTLVAGVAHEINNPNSSMILDARNQARLWDALLPILDEKHRLEGDFEVAEYRYSELRSEIVLLNPRIERNAQRIGRIVEDLRVMSRKEMEIFDDVAINDVVRSALTVIDYRIKRCTQRFSDAYADNIPRIRGNPNYLEQVIINLVKNACQALPDPGKGVYVSTIHDVRANKVVVTVRDEGRGMEKSILDQVFDPFFTTKSQQDGTGLGLSICNNIVRSHDGQIEIESEPEKGTTVRVVLPVDFRKNGEALRVPMAAIVM
jgi:signal transduction histidine kinase